MKKIKNIIQTCVFVIFIFVVSTVCIFTPNQEYSLSERRALAQFPQVNAETVSNGEFMKNFELYAVDQFPLRDKLRGIKAFFSTKALGKLDNNGLFYVDGHISKIDEMPPGRQRVDTFVVDESYRTRLDGFIRKQIDGGGQVYVVCPAVEEQEELLEAWWLRL